MKQIILTLFILNAYNVNAQIWKHLDASGLNNSIGIASIGNKVWVATDGDGLAFKDNTGLWNVYNNTTNSILPNSLKCVSVDNDTTLYVGADLNGLFTFKNNVFTQYVTWNSNIGTNFINCLGSFNTHTYLGTNIGLKYFDNGNFISITSGSSINCLHTIDTGKVWYGTNNGITFYNNAVFTNYNTSNSGICDNFVTAVYADGLNKYIGTSNGLAIYNGTNWDTINTSNSNLTDDYITSLIKYQSEIYIGTTNGGLCKINSNGTVIPLTFPNGPPCIDIGGMSINNNGLWVVCNYSGVSNFNGTNWQYFNNSNTSIPSNSVYDINFNGNNTFVCTNSGVSEITNNGVIAHPLSTSFIYDVDFDNNNLNYYATNQGIYKNNNGTISNYNTSNSTIPTNQIREIAIDNSNNVWLGGGGITVYNGSTFTNYNTSNSPLLGNFVNELFIDNANNKWIATGSGLSKLSSGNVWTNYTTGNSGIPSNNVSDVIVDNNSNVWVTTVVGLAKFDGTTWTIYNTSNSNITSNDLTGVDFDLAGNIWVTSSNAGVFKFNGLNNFINYNINNSGLEDNNVMQVFIDNQQNKWFVLDNGSGISILENCSQLNTYQNINNCGPKVINGITYNATGNYQQTFTSQFGCDSILNLNISISSIPIINTLVLPNDTVCDGTQVLVHAMGGNIINWSNNILDSISFVLSNSNIYTVTVTNAFGCTNTKTQSITLLSLPSLSISIYPNDTVCAGTLMSLTATGASTYLWENGGYNNGDSVYFGGNNAWWNVVATGSNGCVQFDSIFLVFNPKPIIQANASDSVFCIGDSLKLWGSGNALYYTWSNGVIDNLPFVATSVVYTVTGTDANGCTKTTIPALTMNYPPLITTLTPSAVICFGDSVLLFSSTSISNADTYSWNGINGNNFYITPSLDTNINLIVTNFYGCTADSNVQIIVNNNDSAKISISASASSGIAGQVIVFTANLYGASNYLIYWYENGILKDSTTANTWAYGLNSGNNIITAKIKLLNTCSLLDTATSNTIIINNITGFSAEKIDGLHIYPNPANDFILIEVEKNEVVKSIKITDITGRTIIHPVLEKDSRIIINQLKTGNYFLILQTNKKNYTHKFIKSL